MSLLAPAKQSSRHSNADLRIKKAFTLAEVLITLVIIGIIAAITVPMIHANYKKQETVSRLKKAYSTLSQTTNRAIADNGPVKTWEVGLGANNSYKFAKQYLIPYLNVNKDCGITKNTGECEFKITRLDGKNYSLGNDQTYPRFILGDGTSVLLQTTYVKNAEGEIESFVKVFVDINASKKPNILGKDIFSFIYFMEHPRRGDYLGKLIPWWQTSSRDDMLNDVSLGCNKNSSGTACSALIMHDSWQIKEDYPW